MNSSRKFEYQKWQQTCQKYAIDNNTKIRFIGDFQFCFCVDVTYKPPRPVAYWSAHQPPAYQFPTPTPLPPIIPPTSPLSSRIIHLCIATYVTYTTNPHLYETLLRRVFFRYSIPLAAEHGDDFSTHHPALVSHYQTHTQRSRSLQRSGHPPIPPATFPITPAPHKP